MGLRPFKYFTLPVTVPALKGLTYANTYMRIKGLLACNIFSFFQVYTLGTGSVTNQTRMHTLVYTTTVMLEDKIHWWAV